MCELEMLSNMTLICIFSCCLFDDNDMLVNILIIMLVLIKELFIVFLFSVFFFLFVFPTVADQYSNLHIYSSCLVSMNPV